MKVSGVEEKEAFRRLQALATKRNQKLVEAAHIIVAMERVFRPPSTVVQLSTASVWLDKFRSIGTRGAPTS